MEPVFDRIGREQIRENYLARVRQNRPTEEPAVRAWLCSPEAAERARQMAKGAYVPVPEMLAVSKADGSVREVFRYSREDTALMSLMNEALRQYYSRFIRTAMSAPGKNGRYGFIESLAIAFDGKYFVLADIRHFSDSIPEDRMGAALDRFLADDPVFCAFLKALLHEQSYVRDGVLCTGAPAVKAGCSLSPFLTNVYLNDIDHRMAAEERISYFRYIDSTVLLANHRETLEEMLADYRCCLREEGLEMHDGKTILGAPGDVLTWGGFRIGGGKKGNLDLDCSAFTRQLRHYIRTNPAPDNSGFLAVIQHSRILIAMLNRYNRQLIEYHIYRSNPHILAQIQELELEWLRRAVMGHGCKARYSLSYQSILKMGFLPLVGGSRPRGGGI